MDKISQSVEIISGSQNLKNHEGLYWLAMGELGNSLLDAFKKNDMGGYLSIKSTAMLGIELVKS